MSSEKWIEQRYAELKTAPDWPIGITEAINRISVDMLEARQRNKVDKLLSLSHIKTSLYALGWELTRPGKEGAKARAARKSGKRP
jgi:hypothetical protein